MKLNQLTLKQTIKKLKSREISHRELYTDIFSEIDRANPKLNIYLAVDKNAIKNAEKELDKPLAGVPIAIKDNFLTVGLPTTASAKVLQGFNPPYESTVTARLKQAGGVVVGKTNMDAWAHGSSTETSDYGSTLNPRNRQYLPGGSSGGSAAAVAADICTGALGSETAGSIRQPAAWCGVVGLKPTYGRISRAGIVAMGSSLDSPGPLGKTVEDTAILFENIAGYDKYDATTQNKEIPRLSEKLSQGIKNYKIGMCYIDHPKLKNTPVDHAVKEAGKTFEKLGAKVEQILLSDKPEKNKILNPDYAIAVYTVVQRGEVSSNLARYDGIRFGHNRSNFGDEAKRRIMLGTFTLSKGYADKYYVRAQKVRSLFIRNFEDLFSKYDILISPTSPGYALKTGASKDNPMFGELEDMLLEPSSISGLPGINVPMHHDSNTNLYLGLNIVANLWQEEKIVRVAHAFEQNTGWNPWLAEIKE